MAAPGDDASPQNIQAARSLTAEEIERLQKDETLVSEFKQNKLEKEAQKNWDLFYKRNTTKFFKDRHWTKREFEELVGSKEDAGRQKVLFEVGCGVGNFMFPLLEEDEARSLFIYACDFSQRAIQFVKDHPSYDESRCHAFHADITASLSDNIPESSVDMATMIFVLSAIHPDKMVLALRNVLQTLKPGGVLLFRDYGLYDYAMLRFAPGHKLSEHFYVRQDGTRAFYFSLECLQSLAEDAGFEAVQSQYVHRDTVNKKEGLRVPRIFVQAKFVRPPPTASLDSPSRQRTPPPTASLDSPSRPRTPPHTASLDSTSRPRTPPHTASLDSPSRQRTPPHTASLDSPSRQRTLPHTASLDSPSRQKTPPHTASLESPSRQRTPPPNPSRQRTSPPSSSRQRTPPQVHGDLVKASSSGCGAGPCGDQALHASPVCDDDGSNGCRTCGGLGPALCDWDSACGGVSGDLSPTS